MGLPFLLLAWLLALTPASATGAEATVMTFHEFESSCIDLGQYDAATKRLTVRFVNKKSERFYRYSNVPPAVWEKLRKLNESGGVGAYLTETIVQEPRQYPFEELTIKEFKVVKMTDKTAKERKKAGDSK